MSHSTIDTIKLYIQLLVKEFDIDEKELLAVWEKAHPTPIVSEADTFKGLSKAELQQMCKDKNVAHTGTKAVLIDRLLNKEPTPPTSKKTSPGRKKKKVADVIQKIQHNVPIIHIRRNAFNNYEHVETEFVFDETNQMVVGKQMADGNIADLTEADLEICKEYNFKY